MKMSFGKYGPSKKHPRGVDITFINSGYLKWLYGQAWLEDRDLDLCLAIEKELKERDFSHSHFYEDKINV